MAGTGKTATATVQTDNERLRVVRWHFAPGEETGWHTHRWDYVVVPTLDGSLTAVDPDGSETLSNLLAGQSYFRKAGVHHNVINRSAAPVEFVEIELK